MARPKIVRGTYVNILIGNGATLEVFTPICGLTARSFTYQVNTQDTFVRDCADPEDIPVRELILTGEQWDLSGSGLLDRSALQNLNQAVKVKKNYRFEIREPSTDAVYKGHYGGPAVLTQLSINGNDDEFVSVELTIASAGEWVFTAVP